MDNPNLPDWEEEEMKKKQFIIDMKNHRRFLRENITIPPEEARSIFALLTSGRHSDLMNDELFCDDFCASIVETYELGKKEGEKQGAMEERRRIITLLKKKPKWWDEWAC